MVFEDMIQKRFSHILKTKLKEKHMTKAELARQIDVADTTVGRYVRGTMMPRPLILNRIAKVLDIDIREIYSYF